VQSEYLSNPEKTEKDSNSDMALILELTNEIIVLNQILQTQEYRALRLEEERKKQPIRDLWVGILIGAGSAVLAIVGGAYLVKAVR
jgi:hypothetical protein